MRVRSVWIGLAAWLAAAAMSAEPAAAQKIIHVGPGDGDGQAPSVRVYKYGALVSGTPKENLPRVIAPDFAVPDGAFFPPCSAAPSSHAHEAGMQARFNGVTAGHDAPLAWHGAGACIYADGSRWASHIEGGLTVENGSRWASHIRPGRTVEDGSRWASHIEGGKTVAGGSRRASHIRPGRTVEGGSRWASHIRPGRTVRNGARWASTIPSWPRGVPPPWASR